MAEKKYLPTEATHERIADALETISGKKFVVYLGSMPILRRATAYAIEDFAFCHNIIQPYICLACVKAGVTSTDEPDFSALTVGQYITDGTATFLAVDIRDGAQVGDIKMSPILRKGYVQANGALLTSASVNYPRLVDFVQENPSLLAADDTAWNSNKALYVYDDTNDTLRVPDATGRVLQGGASVQSVEAGLPNITGVLAAFEGLTEGAFSEIQHYGAVGGTGYGFGKIQIDASRSSSIYGNSTTVQPPALSLISQIKY